MHDEELGKFMATGNWFTTCFLCLISPFRMESIIVSVCSSVPRFPMSCFFCCCYVLIICDAICHYLFHRLCIYILLPFGWTAIRFVIAMFTFRRAHSPSWTNICFTTSPEHWTCSHWAACHNIFGVCVCVFFGNEDDFRFVRAIHLCNVDNHKTLTNEWANDQRKQNNNTSTTNVCVRTNDSWFI